MMALDFNTVAQSAAIRVADSLVLSSLVAVFAFGLMRMLRRQSSAVRFAVCFSALVAMGVLPCLEGVLPFRSAAHPALPAAHSLLTLPDSWALYLSSFWFACAGIALARLGIGLWNLRALRHSLTEVDLNLFDAEVRRALEDHQKDRATVLCTSDRVTVPTAVGLIKPAVVIPTWLIQELTPAQLNQVVLHELAHLRRWDDWTNLAQKILKALFFFHPAVWWIEKRISLEREMACDDIVLAESANPQAYAECLVQLAEKSFARRSLALAQAAVGRVRQTTTRVAAILKVSRPSPAATNWKPAVSLVGAFAVLCAAGIKMGPRLVAFESATPRTVAALTTARARVVSASLIENPSRPIKVKAAILKAPVRPRAVAARASQNRGASRDNRYSTYAVPEIFAGKTATAKLVHAAEFRTPPLPTGTLLFVVEQGQFELAEPRVRKVSLWYIVVVPAPSDPLRGIPRKET